MSNSIPKVGFISLGCPKATVDSERILTQLRAEGYLITPSYEDADVVVVNTCGFIDEAVQESLEVIGEALSENGHVIVTGCLGAKGDIVKQVHPAVLAVTGPNSLPEVISSIHAILPPQHDPYMDLVPPGGIKLTPRHYAYIKIAEGCNQHCSFCIIPSMRGKLVSRPIGDILDEAEKLVSAGVQELLIVSQDTAAYGVDTKYKLDFWQGRPLKTQIHELTKALSTLGVWVRLHYIYPYPHIDTLVEQMAEGLVLPYLDVPLQHGNPRILKAMRRPADAENMLQRIEKWRNICPDITLRSTFIVGFPGETEAEFEQLLDFIREARLDRVGAFTYSPVEGASANNLPNPVPDEVKEERIARFMAMQSEISADKLQDKIGQTLTVMIDEVTSEGIYARTSADAPEIDGMVILSPDEDDELSIIPGDLWEVTIIDADEHDLYAEFVLNEND
ncbi:30S ribosomal protein S12 methylthiotransferase RimO [Beggiatoa leptomitoformis]|uniref:Ribosomal protein uS12 methylthiotransferase RimO n=1 Tax=Beggiatoa leptomitoformis TaxID=288004 RepID=A0A2N9YJL2_9GAMM|nr:30S ribosomal protein S12 methylthiotransferase RimO [Beggiatoa leptomitoformis]ALG67343.1 30S ribosomal protein S12 methylthiotransferase RimO [Beggiatoa leptomitoformis]AUI70456.1 30S ribosomal protein S12 methylthiotransferase RimO [Beggiatoa leptomitoformis]